MRCSASPWVDRQLQLASHFRNTLANAGTLFNYIIIEKAIVPIKSTKLIQG